MPFGPKNDPVFYTVMMQSLRKEWFLLFVDTKHVVPFDTVHVTTICNDKIIIDDVLLYSNHILALFHYVSYVGQAFTKYRLSFKLTKCDFFKPHIGFVGHDLTTYRNFPTESEFDLIQHRTLSPHAIFLLSFICLYEFYSQYCLWFEKISNHFVNFNVIFIVNPLLLFFGHFL